METHDTMSNENPEWTSDTSLKGQTLLDAKRAEESVYGSG